MSERHLVDPTPELPDDTPVDRVRFPTRIQNVLVTAGLKTVGEVRETADETLLSFQDFGPGSITHLRKTLGLPSRDGVSPDNQARHGRLSRANDKLPVLSRMRDSYGGGIGSSGRDQAAGQQRVRIDFAGDGDQC
jgi:hypothetical protein